MKIGIEINLVRQQKGNRKGKLTEKWGVNTGTMVVLMSDKGSLVTKKT